MSLSFNLFSFRPRSDRVDYQQYNKQSNYWNGSAQHTIAPIQDFGGPNQYKKRQQRQDQEQSNEELSVPVWQHTELKPFRKNFYQAHSNTEARTQREVDNYREVNDIIVRGKDIPQPNYCFEENSFPEYIMQILLKQGFAGPTAIQSQGNS